MQDVHYRSNTNNLLTSSLNFLNILIPKDKLLKAGI